jgi:hypothetical protein
VHGAADAISDGFLVGRVELAIEMQERQTVDECPDGRRERVRVSTGKRLPDDRHDVGGDRLSRGDSVGTVPVAGLTEHHPEQCRSLQGELNVGDGYCCQVVRRGRRRVCCGQELGQFPVADGSDGGEQRVPVGVVPLRRRSGDTRSSRGGAQGELCAAALLEQLQSGTHERGTQIAVVVRGTRQ